MIKTMPLEKLVEDMDFYPRNDVSATCVASLVDAINVGVTLPAIVVDQKSLRIVDGVHRYRAYKRLKRKTIECDLRAFASDAAIYEAATALNISHGRRLDPYDLRRVVARMAELGIEREKIAQIIHVPATRLDELSRGSALSASGPVPLKYGLLHMANRKITERQRKAIERASGMNAVYHANQLINLLENGLLPASEKIVEAMDTLVKLWRECRKKAAGS